MKIFCKRGNPGDFQYIDQPIVRETLAYIFWGGMTTIINITSFFIVRLTFGLSAMVSNIIAWFISVIFAFIANRRFVFASCVSPYFPFTFQFILFIMIRLLSGAAETIMVFIMIDILAFAALPVKILSSCVIVVLNYIAGKWLIFRKGDANALGDK